MLNTISSFFKSTIEHTPAELEAESKRRLEKFKSEYHILIETMFLRFAKSPTDFSLVPYPYYIHGDDRTLLYHKLFDLVCVDQYCHKDKSGCTVIDNKICDYIYDLCEYYLPKSCKYRFLYTYNSERLSTSYTSIILTFYVRVDASIQVSSTKYEVELEKKNCDAFASKLINDEWKNIVVSCEKFCSNPIEKSELFVFDIDCGTYATHDETGCDRIVAIVTDAIHKLIAEKLGTKTFKISSVINKKDNLARCYLYGEKNI